MASRDEQDITSTVAFGILGAALVYFGRRANSGILGSLATTAGYGLITRAVSTALVATLSPSTE